MEELGKDGETGGYGLRVPIATRAGYKFSVAPNESPLSGEALLELLEPMIAQQREKVLATARRRVPYLTGDDILNPHDFPELERAPEFHYEDGILAGLLAAQMALRAKLREPR